MPIKQFVSSVKRLHDAVEAAKKGEIASTDPSPASVHDFKSQQKESLKGTVLSSIATVDIKSHALFSLIEADKSNRNLVDSILRIVGQLGQTKGIDELASLANTLAVFSADLPQGTEETVALPKVPAEIHDDIAADWSELTKCMKIGAYRSGVILCGRVLEVALHRKYFELTGNDLLEKAPGTGLGNLTAKMAEKGETIDPGLGNQIHLINQVRVHSVHKKQTPFSPSKQQAQAIMLYTSDVLAKLWRTG